MARITLCTFFVYALLGVCTGCNTENTNANHSGLQEGVDITERLKQYAVVPLKSDLSHLSEREKEMLPLFVESVKLIDEMFWQQAWGKEEVLISRVSDPLTQQYIRINYGPYDRLDNNRPFLKNITPKPLGANFYPEDFTLQEYLSSDLDQKGDPFAFIRRDDKGKLYSVGYHKAFAATHQKIANLLQKAAGLSELPLQKKYLTELAIAMISGNYLKSQNAWLDMKDNQIDIVIGPLQNYEDKLLNKKTGYEGYVLIKDNDWSKKLEQYAVLLPEFQENLPVPDIYKQDQAELHAEINAYDVIFQGGYCNAGSKTVGVILPARSGKELGFRSRRMQFKNIMRAKFDKVLIPISDLLIAEDQRKHVTFDAFFGNNMFHEIAHGLGVRKTVFGGAMIKDVMRNLHSTIEEGKADVLGIYLVTFLHDTDRLSEQLLMDHYVTFLASIFRSTRFGASSDHGRANMMRFYYFKKEGAFVYNAETGRYRIDVENMRRAIQGLSSRILQIQGQGDYEAAAQWIKAKTFLTTTLQSDIDRLKIAGVPVDLVFEQGMEVLGERGQKKDVRGQSEK